MADAVIDIQNLSKRYRLGQAQTLGEAVGRLGRRLTGRPADDGEADRAFWALRDVSFRVEPGEAVGLIGRNGAGKSTLLKILSRITVPTAGRAVLRGRVASLLEVGTGFHPELTGRENIYLNGSILGMRRREVRAKYDEIVAFSGVERFLDTPVKRYSSGMRVRLAFAVAAHLEPELLLIDEVLAVGDAAFQKRCLGKMRELAGTGRTVLFVSHNMGAVTGLTRRCVLLGGGRVEADGPSSEIVARYLDAADVDAAGGWCDLRDAERESGVGREWSFTGARLVTDGPALRFGGSLELELSYAAHRSAEDVLVGVGVCNLDGSRVMTLLSSEAGVVFDTGAGQRGTIRMTLPGARLWPGKYMIQVGAVTGTQFTLDYVARALCFEVRPNLTQHAWFHNQTNLGVSPKSAWSIESEADHFVQAVA